MLRVLGVWPLGPSVFCSIGPVLPYSACLPRACAAALRRSRCGVTLRTAACHPPRDLAASAASGCFAAGDGYLRARMRGALDLDLDWKDAQMQCEGGPRPPGNGVRVSIGGPLRGDGRRIRMVFGIAGVGEGDRRRDACAPTSRILFEGEQRVFATLGDDKCTVDSLTQQRVETLGPRPRHLSRRGARLLPRTRPPACRATSGVLLTSFDFAGRVRIRGR